tara:strand:- start:404 stop:595 length:192 start_codon:yes stop_codon:yes gene_type:complete
MEDIEKLDSKWSRRDSKNRAKKNFTIDNRRSIRWIYRKAGEKARDIQLDRERETKEQESWLHD